MIVETKISYGHSNLIKVFFEANNLAVHMRDMSAYPFGKVILEYEDNSDTAFQITFMSYKHAGFENMLWDYLIRCGIDPSLIPIGNSNAKKRDMKELDDAWEKHRKEIGFGVR